jgi:hypothetical protein
LASSSAVWSCFIKATCNLILENVLRKHTGSFVKKEYRMLEGFNVAASGLTHSSPSDLTDLSECRRFKK